MNVIDLYHTLRKSGGCGFSANCGKANVQAYRSRSLFQSSAKYFRVADIGLERDVCYVADERDDADQPVNDEVEQHARPQEKAELVLLRDIDRIQPDQRRNRIPKNRNEPDNRIEPKADAGELELRIHEFRQPIHVLDIALS